MRGKGLILAVALLGWALPSAANACIRIEGQQGAWNLRFINTCGRTVLVTWYCSGNCANGCSTNPIRPGGYDNGYCHEGQVRTRWQYWP
jgi:hypothetical protein